MDFIYVLTMIILGIAFMLYKKSEEKISFVKWLIIFILTVISYNILIAMVFGLLAIASNMLMLSIINLAFSVFLGYKAIKNKDFQKYYFSKMEIAGLLVVFVVFGVMLVKDVRIQKGDIVHIAIDSSIHYRAAKHYADTMMAFINVEDKTFFDFNIMQTGAYVNDGLLMHVVNSLSGGRISYVHTYEFFESLMLFMCGLGFYAMVMDKIKTKLGFVLSMAFYGLFIYGYPYNSYLYGFSYLTVGMVTTIAFLVITPLLYSKEKINKNFIIALIGITGTGLIFSYCLFAPIVFATVCIYTFIKDFKEEGKSYLKIFKGTTLAVGFVLFAVALVGVFYFIIPAHFINGQKPISDAIKNDGAIYSELWRDIIYYVPFGILYLVTCFKRFKAKESLEYLDVFAWFYGAFYAIMYIGMRLAVLSPYYFYKTYFVLWIVILAITVDLINRYVTVSKIKWAVGIYSGVWPVFVVAMIIIKASTILPEDTKHAITNYIGMYYSENCEFRGSARATLNFSNAKQEIANYVRENLEDANADNTILMTGTYNERCWATVTTELSSDNLEYRDVIQDTRMHHIRELYYNDDAKYAVSFQGTNDYDKWPYKDNFKVLFQNEAGYVIEKIED
jgi:hypothetical protein